MYRESFSVKSVQLLAMLAMLYGALSIAGQIMAAKTFTIFGIATTAGVFFMSATFPLNAIITQQYGRNVIKSLISSTLVSLIIISLALHFLSSIYGNPISSLDDSYKQVFSSTQMRVALASLISYLLSENTTSIIMSILEKSKIKVNFIRVVLAAFMGIIIDSIVFINIAFLGVFEFSTVLQLVISLIIVKGAITILLCVFVDIVRLFGK